MPALKSANIYQRFEDFSVVTDRAYKSRTTGWSADDAKKYLGIQVVKDGHYMERGEDYNYNPSTPAKGLPDPFQRAYKPVDPQDPSNYYASRPDKANPTTPKQKNYYPQGPDIPFDEEYKPGVKPRNRPRS